jgi:hypothetical protein
MKSSELLNDVIKNLSDFDKEDLSDSRLKSFKLMVGKSCDMDGKDVKIIKEFLDYCASVLKLEKEYRCYLAWDRKKSKIKTTAICSFSQSNIRVYCKSRSLADILRSIAHETFHLRQHEVGAVPRKMPPHHLNPVEFDANIFGGSMISIFASKKGRDEIYR